MRYIPARLWALAALSGVLQVLPFPIAGPVPLWRTAFCWFALLPLLAALLGTDTEQRPLSILQSAALGYLSGFLWYFGNCYWIYQTMNLYGGLAKPTSAGILVLFCLYLGLYHALFGVLIGAFRRLPLGRNYILLLAPFAWVAVELARARITGLPWDLLGITQIDNALLIRLAPITGAYGLSFVVALVNSLWLMRFSLRERRYTRPALSVAGVLLVLLYVIGTERLPRIPQAPATATATLVQENLEVGAADTGPQYSTRELLDSFSYLSRHPAPTFLAGIPELPGTPRVVLLHRSASPEGTDQTQNWTPHSDLIVWPESPAPFQENDPQFRNAISTLARQSGAAVIVGNIGTDRVPPGDRDPDDNRGYKLYNSADFVAPDGTFVGRYDKMHLVPFGEYVPFKKLFFFAKNLLNEVGTFDPGRNREVFTTGGHTYGVFICYESVFADEIRQFELKGAQVLVNISNDGWYGDTSAAWQHLNMVRMRAVENHRWILRSTNTGVTAAIDPRGRVTMAAPRHRRTSLHVVFGYESDITFYAAHGDLFAYLCALITALAFVAGLLLQSRPGPPAHFPYKNVDEESWSEQ
ncbi:MAG TPA: apolipoprotein N-acyltransferase [Granulicella sp.]|nr:apolipoprotein N-acyltransferase [Granulicella sp.]